MSMSTVQQEALRRRALEHRARWEAQRREVEERRAREREDENVARASRAAREIRATTNDDDDDDDDERLCRICFSGEDGGRLFSPCRCRGSMALVHVECLNEWRNLSRNPRSFYGCDQCGYQYNLERTRAARYLEREEPALVFAVVGVFLLTLFVAALCRAASHGAFLIMTRVRQFLQARNMLRSRPSIDRILAELTMKRVQTHRGVTLHASTCYVEVFFYRLVRWIPPWRDLRRADSWFHAPRVIAIHEYLDFFTGGYLMVGLLAFIVSMYNKIQVQGIRRVAEFVGPSFAFVFAANGLKGARLPLFAGSLYAYAKLHEYAKLKSRALLMRIGQRVLEVQ
jgi:hypothetical protein